MDSLEKEELARQLSRRDGPSVLEKERVLEQVFSQLEPEARTSMGARFAWWFAAAAVPVLAAAWLMLQPSAPDEFAARGGGAPTPSFGLRCMRDGAPSACKAGATLAFEVAGTAQLDHVAIVGVREDGALLWYSPARGQTSAAVASMRSVLPSGAVLDAEQLAGRVVVRALFSPEPLTRDQITAALAAPAAPHVVVERDLAIGVAP
jgi:hypothetical protein